MKHYKDFFELVKDYYIDLNDACYSLDQDEHIPLHDGNDSELPFINVAEQLRLALHIILDGVDQIDNDEFWNFVNQNRTNMKK